MPKLTALQTLGIGKEAQWGTAATTFTHAPFNSFKAENEIANVVDNGKRGNINADFDVIFTTKKATLDMETYLYADVVGLFLKNVFGKDDVTGTGAPYVHKFTPDSAQSSLTVSHYNGSDERQYAGAIVDEVSIKGDTENPITVSVKLQGKMGKIVTKTTPTYAADLRPLVGALAALKIDTVANTNLFGFEITFKRENKMIFGASATQDPTKAVQGVFSVEGKLTFDVEGNEEFSAYEAQTSHNVELTLDGDTNHKCKISLAKAFIEKASFDDGEQSLRVDWEFRGVYDATAGGSAVVELTNTTASY